MTLALYGDVETNLSGHLDVGGGHRIYYEVLGNPDGIPAVFIHGGPGAPYRYAHKQLFDPGLYRVVFYHQRGCGLSTPYLSLENNSIETQLGDIRALRRHLGIDRPWIVFGNSWGTALAQIYATRYREDIRHLVLCGVSFADQQDAAAFMEGGYASRLRPDHFVHYRDFIPEDERAEKGLGRAYYDRVFSGDPQIEMQAIKHWSLWNYALLTLNMERRAMEKARQQPEVFATVCKFFLHYYTNEYSPSNREHIWPYLGNIRDLPTTIMHGRYDLICPPDNAWELHQELPGSTLQYVTGCGHFMLEPAYAREVMEVLDALASTA